MNNHSGKMIVQGESDFSMNLQNTYTVDPRISEPKLSDCSDYPKCMRLQLHH